jgi:RecB family exonuclease
VIWWDLNPQSQPLTYPWSKAELTELRAAGVALPTAEERLAHRSRTWLRPILNCRERLVLVVHRSDEGHHPLWTQIASVFHGWAEVDLESRLLEGAEPSLSFLGVATEPLEVKPLPPPRRWWDLPKDVAIPTRPLESYSSLSKLFYYPHGWVLNYAAALRTGRTEDVADGPLLYGTLAHRLFEEFFRTHPDWRAIDRAAVMAWLEESLPRLIAEEGAVLLEPGRGVDHERVITTLERALLRLLEHLADADVVNVQPEQTERAPFLTEGLELGGAIDLLLTTAGGQEVVLDAKWGSENYRAKELEDNLHPQLASYAYLRKNAACARKTAAGSRDWPYQVYFIITTGNVLAPDDEVFREALVRRPAGGVDVAGLWARAEATYAWRRAQLDAGHVEVCAEDTQPTERSQPPDDALGMRDGADPFDNFKRLIGWDQFA